MNTNSHNPTPELSFFEKMIMEELRELRKENKVMKKQLNDIHNSLFKNPIQAEPVDEKTELVNAFRAKIRADSVKKTAKKQKHL